MKNPWPVILGMFLLVLAVAGFVLGWQAGAGHAAYNNKTYTANTADAAQGLDGGCRVTSRVIIINLDNRKHRHILRHAWRAIRQGEPEVWHLARGQADANRAASLAGIPSWGQLSAAERRDIDPDHPNTLHDRDEVPPAFADEGGRGGPPDSPRGRLADVAYILSSENRSAGAIMGAKMAPYCSGQRFRLERKPGPKS